ncbi:MAG: PepSY-associated TM helix domain-containing protein [Burkholderiales bacterium]|nr:PepSY-associated TM helix domain-containing protein [Burkholderiales bacterium]
MTFRKNLLLVHRWTGIVLATFLVLAGLTGSLLAFHHEIDAVLVPELHSVTPTGTMASLDEVAARIEAAHPGLVVGYFLFSAAEGSSIRAIMNTVEAAEAGRLDRDSPRPSEVYINPHSGAVLGTRNWGEVGLSRAHLVPMIYRFHMSLLLGKTGQWIMGIIAVLWMATMMVGAFLAVPRIAHLQKAFVIKWQSSRARMLFDLHRSVGLIGGVLLVVIAFTGLYMNLPQVIEPAVAAMSPFSERPASVRSADQRRDQTWQVGWDAALATARAAHPVDPVAGIGKIEARGYYQVRFLLPGDIMDSGTVRYFVDGRNGQLLGHFNHRSGTLGDKIRVWQFPLHSGQGFGMPGRVLVLLIGLLPPLLALSGLWLWLRRRRLRRAAMTETDDSPSSTYPTTREFT